MEEVQKVKAKAVKLTQARHVWELGIDAMILNDWLSTLLTCCLIDLLAYWYEWYDK